uniref:Uncharacterized protein n=1 Tax=viral metagenome TaxID=1070528 RepID=A0A6C0BEJ9_9ZZZZ
MSKEEEVSDFEIEEFVRCFNRDEEYHINYNLYGPANPMRPDEFDDKPYICKFSPTGICHMLTCMCLEDNAYDVKDNDWYTGICLECDNKILNKKSAWRMPCKNGGFLNCYCSEQHMVARLVENEDDEYIALAKVMKAIRMKFPISYVNIDKINDFTIIKENNFDL